MSLSKPTVARRPFAATSEKYNMEHASGKVTVSNFPYHVIQSLPGYTKRARPGLTASDVAKDAARYLAEYSDTEGCPMPYKGRDVGFYLWMQAGRKKLEWDTIVKLVSANRKRDPEKNSARYFGHREVIEEEKGRAEKRDLNRLVRYVVQEGVCSGCQVEFQYDELTLDRTRPGRWRIRIIQRDVDVPALQQCQRFPIRRLGMCLYFMIRGPVHKECASHNN